MQPDKPEDLGTGEVGSEVLASRSGRSFKLTRASSARLVSQRLGSTRASVVRGKVPNLVIERSGFVEGHSVVAGVDEVGRGPLAGPVTVGIVAVDGSCKRPPSGLRDSKLLDAPSREALVPRIKRWAANYAVGHASAAEIDQLGILRGLRLAGERAMMSLGMRPDFVLLDGNYDWLTRPASCLPQMLWSSELSVKAIVKADLTCASVAAASILAKVERDGIMSDLSLQYPGYGWQRNKGYGTAEHRRALQVLGPSEQHRQSWNLGLTRP